MRRGFSALIATTVLWSLSNATALAASPGPSTPRSTADEALPAKFGGSLVAHWAAGADSAQTSPRIAPKSAPACTGAWNLVSSPTNGSGANVLNGTAALSATDVWAAGVYVDLSATPNRDQIYFEHWDGSTWSVVTTPNVTNGGAETGNVANAIAALSSTDVWAVGSFVNASGISQPLVDHWNGTAWAPSSLPSQGGGSNDLFGVSAIAANDIWAVGYWRPDNTSARQALAWHWNGAAWSPSFPPSLGGNPDYSFSLFGVSASAGNNVIAVGRYLYRPTGVSYAIIDRWDGSSWTETIPTYSYAYQVLFSVSVLSSTEAWAVGFEDDSAGAPDHTFIWHWNGSGWVSVPSPNIGGSQHPNNELYSVAATSATNAWAVGAAFGPFNSAGQPSSGQTLVTHWDGTSWAASPGADSSGLDELLGIVTLSATNAWAVGDAVIGTADKTLTENLCVGPPSVTGLSPSGGPITGGNQVAISGANFTTVSAVMFGSNAASSFTLNSSTSITAVAPAGAAGTVDVTVTNAVSASPTVPSDQYRYVPPPSLANISPTSGPEAGGTPVTITGTNFTADATVSFGGLPATGVVVNSATSISATSPAHCPGMADVTVATPGGTTPTTPTDQFTFVGDLCAAVSTAQYSLTASDGATWKDVDPTRLSITLTPNVNSRAILSANADLWTSTAGYNQDLAITVNGVVSGWKESGGFAGTFSPNAAFVQTVADMTAGVSYTIKLQWKTNIAASGTIWAGAGPIGGRYSPTSLTMLLVPSTSTNVVSSVSTQQYLLTGNDGNAWTDIDPVQLSLPDFTAPAGGGTALIGGNADLWTTSPGYNQDLGISVVDLGLLPCTGGAGAGGCQPVAWKESGGFAGTYSPNAAFVHAAYPMAAGHQYRIRLQWKTNKADPHTIVAGAGPIAAKFSPTSLSMQFVPSSTGVDQATTTDQLVLSNSDGASWQPLGPLGTIGLPIPAPTKNCQALISGNADLWTANAGYNQDLGIAVNGTVVAWKESGGYAGTFSPNAAYVQTLVPLTAGVAYTVQLEWKTNRPASGTTIYAGAGPIGANFSPTGLTIQLDGCS